MNKKTYRLHLRYLINTAMKYGRYEEREGSLRPEEQGKGKKHARTLRKGISRLIKKIDLIK